METFIDYNSEDFLLSNNCNDLNYLLYEFNLSICNNFTDVPEEEEAGLLRSTLTFLQYYVTPVITVFGLVGSCLMLLVFGSRRHRRKTSSVYLCSLATSDIFYQLAILLVSLEKVGFAAVSLLPYRCHWLTYIMNVCPLWSMECILVVIAERYVRLSRLYRYNYLCSTSRAKTVVVALFLFALCFNCYIFVVYEITSIGHVDVCIPQMSYYNVIIVMSALNVLFALAPSVTLIAFNVIIGFQIRQFKKLCVRSIRHVTLRQGNYEVITMNRRQHSDNVEMSRRSEDNDIIRYRSCRFNISMETRNLQEAVSNSNLDIWLSQARLNNNSTNRLGAQLTRAQILLTLSSILLLLRLPNLISQLYAMIAHLRFMKMNHSLFVLWYDLFQQVYSMSFSVNFVVFFACDRTFRDRLSFYVHHVTNCF